MLTQDLRAIARQAMIDAGFQPDYTAGMNAELQQIGRHPDTGAALKDLRDVLWSSIDNADTRDLDQIEYAEQAADGSWRLMIAIADVDAEVPKGSAIDAHAEQQTTTV